MKKAVLTMCVCSLCFAIVTGCGNKETGGPSADIVEAVDSVERDGNPEEGDVSSEAEDEGVSLGMADVQGSEEDKFADLTNEEVPETEIDPDKFTDELCGNVRSINAAEKFVVIRRIYTEENGDALIAVQPAEGSSDEQIITVYFTGEAKYILETGKADGTNVTRTEVGFSDIVEKDVLNLKGMENTVGTEFLATEVEIIRVID